MACDDYEGTEGAYLDGHYDDEDCDVDADARVAAPTKTKRRRIADATSRLNKRCKHCGGGLFRWGRYESTWRLFEADGMLHSCTPTDGVQRGE